MNKALRREYLSALGLDSWVLRAPRVGAANRPPLAPEASRDLSGVRQGTAASNSSGLQDGAAPSDSAGSRDPAAVGNRTASPDRQAAGGNRAGLREPEPASERILLGGGAASGDFVGLPARDADCDMPGLRARVAACTRCGLAATRTQTVFGVGNPTPDWLVVGEAPGADEDRAGEPFVGAAGQLLNAMLKAIGLPRNQVYIANVLKCRPPLNRKPAATEVAECIPYLERQIALLKPKIMLCVGLTAAQNLLRTDLSLSRLRQQVHVFGESRVPLVVTYHPAYLLRTPADKRLAWEDLKFAREVFARG